MNHVAVLQLGIVVEGTTQYGSSLGCSNSGWPLAPALVLPLETAPALYVAPSGAGAPTLSVAPSPRPYDENFLRVI